MKKFFIGMVLTSLFGLGCIEDRPATERTKLPVPPIKMGVVTKYHDNGQYWYEEDAQEMDYKTTHNGKVVYCRLLWVGAYHGGPATLWCDSVPQNVDMGSGD